MEAEIRLHLESHTEDLIREGLTRNQATRQAKLEFGGIASHKDSMRASLGLRCGMSSGAICGTRRAS
jgi:hypothetical protein